MHTRVRAEVPAIIGTHEYGCAISPHSPCASATGPKEAYGSAALSYAGPPKCGDLSVTIEGIESPSATAAWAYGTAGAKPPAGGACLRAATVARGTTPP